jgi:hypothetical protein
MSSRRCIHNGSGIEYKNDIGYWQVCSVLSIPQTASLLDNENNSKSVRDYSIIGSSNGVANELHPLRIYQNMIETKAVQSMRIYDTKFEFKNLRKKLWDRLFELGNIFNMDLLTLHIALKYLETMLHFINFYKRNNRTQRIPSDPKPVKDIVDKTSPLFGKDMSSRIKSLSMVKKELLTISWLLIAAKFNDWDENMVTIKELQKECKYNFTWK